MNCLINTIGLKKLDGSSADSEPESGLYINSLPGISTEILQDIADSDGKEYARVWQDVQLIAAKRIYIDLIAKLRSVYKVRQAKGNFLLEPISLEAVIAREPKKKGLLLGFTYASRLSMQAFYITDVYLKSLTAGTSTLYIQDGEGNILKELQVNVKVGSNTFKVNEAYFGQDIFIGFDYTNIDVNSNELGFADGYLNNAIGVISRGSSGAVVGAIFEDNAYTVGNTSFGVGVRGYTACSVNGVVCYNRDLFSAAWLYLLGTQIMTEALGSNRINDTTTVNLEKYEGLRDLYQIDYEKALTTALAAIDVNSNDTCIECETSSVKRVRWTP